MSRRAKLKEPIIWTEEYLINELGVDPVEAEFMIAIHKGKITGDIEEKRKPRRATLK